MTRLAIVVMSTALALMGCDQPTCDRAIERICNDGAIDCRGRPPPIIDTLRRCDSDEIYGDRDYHLAVCTGDSVVYPKILSALEKGDQMLCTMR
jgi:hypothetical protein